MQDDLHAYHFGLKQLRNSCAIQRGSILDEEAQVLPIRLSPQTPRGAHIIHQVGLITCP